MTPSALGKTNVFDGDDGLVSEGLEQLDLPPRVKGRTSHAARELVAPMSVPSADEVERIK